MGRLKANSLLKEIRFGHMDPPACFFARFLCQCWLKVFDNILLVDVLKTRMQMRRDNHIYQLSGSCLGFQEDFGDIISRRPRRLIHVHSVGFLELINF